MKKRDQRALTNALLKGFSESVRARIKHVPKDWDGNELRQWITDLCHEYMVAQLPRSRMQSYNNERSINPNL